MYAYRHVTNWAVCAHGQSMDRGGVTFVKSSREKIYFYSAKGFFVRLCATDARLSLSNFD